VKRSRNEAQTKIIEVDRRLSEDLLGHENAAFAGIQREFRVHIPDIPLKTVAGVKNNRQLREVLVNAHSGAIEAALGWVQRLARLSGDRGVAAIREELALCEDALPARYRGVVAAAMPLVDPAPIAKLRVEEWISVMALRRAEYRRAQTEQINRAKDMPELQLRLFSPKPSGIRGHNRRGVWWTACSAAQEYARAVSIGVANDVKLKGISELNRAGASWLT
jgi:hypothetical protein